MCLDVASAYEYQNDPWLQSRFFFACIQEIRACISVSSMALKMSHQPIGFICRYFKVMQSRRIPRSTRHQNTRTFGTTCSFHSAVHNCLLADEVSVIVPSSRELSSLRVTRERYADLTVYCPDFSNAHAKASSPPAGFSGIFKIASASW
jgi:hypothetical protein